MLPQLAAAARRRSSPYSGFARMGKTGDSHPRASPRRSRAAHRRSGRWTSLRSRCRGRSAGRQARTPRLSRAAPGSGPRRARAAGGARAGAAGAGPVSAGYRVLQPRATCLPRAGQGIPGGWRAPDGLVGFRIASRGRWDFGRMLVGQTEKPSLRSRSMGGLVPSALD